MDPSTFRLDRRKLLFGALAAPTIIAVNKLMPLSHSPVYKAWAADYRSEKLFLAHIHKLAQDVKDNKIFVTTIIEQYDNTTWSDADNFIRLRNKYLTDVSFICGTIISKPVMIPFFLQWLN